jgi:hypothetical protein
VRLDLEVEYSESLLHVENNMILRKGPWIKTREITLKPEMNTKLATCDDKGVFTDDEDTYRKYK